MRYWTGEIALLGDRVVLGDNERAPGIVLADMDGGTYSADNDGWAYLKQGVMIEFKAYGLIHYIEPDEDLLLVARADDSNA